MESRQSLINRKMEKTTSLRTSDSITIVRKIIFLCIILFLGIQNSFSQIRLIKDIYEGQGYSNPNIMGIVNGKVLFQANMPDYGTELWVTDGTESGTVMLKDINKGSRSSIVSNGFLTIDTLLFMIVQDTNITRFSLWRSDGTNKGTYRLTYLPDLVIPSKDRGQLAIMGNRLYFAGGDQSTDKELWVSDGTIAGTKLVKDINPGNIGSHPFNMTVIDKHIYFYADDGICGYELWKSDGTETGTVLVKDIWSGPVSSIMNLNFKNSIGFNGKLYFQAIESYNSGTELYVSDGTDTGTKMLMNLTPNPNINSNPILGASSDSFFVFYHSDPTSFIRLKRSDGTINGTFTIIDSSDQITNAVLLPLGIPHKSRLIFPVSTKNSGYELWTTDGTKAGTKLLMDINGGIFGGYGGLILNHKGTVCFSANNGFLGKELWKTDGTTEGTKLLVETLPGNSNSNFTSFIVYKDQLIAAAQTDTKIGLELYSIDLGFYLDLEEIRNPRSKIYPNPASPGSIIKFEDMDYITCSIFDLNGKEIYRVDISQAAEITLPVELGAGIYMLTLTGEGKTLHQIMMIENR